MKLWERIAYEPVTYAYRILAILVGLVLLWGLLGCTHFGNERTQIENKPLTGVCALKPIAERGGVTYVQYHCEAD